MGRHHSCLIPEMCYEVIWVQEHCSRGHLLALFGSFTSGVLNRTCSLSVNGDEIDAVDERGWQSRKLVLRNYSMCELGFHHGCHCV